MKKLRTWTAIRKNLSKILNISPEILDFLSNYDIILLSLSGMSNKDISKKLNISESSVKKAILITIGASCNNWDGFRESGCLNPYFVMKSLNKELGRVPTEVEFSDEMQRLTGDPKYLGEELEKIYQLLINFSTQRYTILTKYRKEDYGNYISRHA